MRSAFLSFPVFVLFTLLLCGCGHGRQQPSLQPAATPPILFADDGDRQSLLACARTHRDYLASLPAGYRVTISATSYPLSWLRLSLDEFIALLENTTAPQALSDRIVKDFTVIEAGGKPGTSGNEMLVTGYYEPLFAGSLERKGPYQYPLYGLPETLVVQSDPTKTCKKRVGRRGNDGAFRPFWSRAEIETSHYLSGTELAYLKDPFDAFLLHVQGSGRIMLPDGSQRTVRFAGHNGHAYKSIGSLLVKEGKLTLEESSVPAIRRYLDNHPGEMQRILHYNPRYIFFTWGDELPPHGSLGQPLTAGRSIAIDRKALPDTLVGWLETSMPVVDDKGGIEGWRTSRRFVLPQDSGAAIQGTGRVDLFLGSGLYAETAAGTMREKGRLLFFIKKGYTAR